MSKPEATQAELLRQIVANTERATFLLQQVEAMDCPPVDRVVALLTAATTIIERNVGREHAGQMLIQLIAPSMAEWDGREPAGTIQ